jgi:Zn-dependent M28 family amino/carboxypeptidase
VLAGSTKYVQSLNGDQLSDIALYLNFDMLGSPNAGFFTYDGDQSGQANPDVPANTVPVGSAGIERTMAGYLNLAGIRPADLPLGKASDYSPFLDAGVPIGGTTTGAAQRKTELQARLWGGVAGVAFDRNYHLPGDSVDSVNRDALAVTGPAVAFAVGTYAQSIEGVNGVPTREQRRRHTP